MSSTNEITAGIGHVTHNRVTFDGATGKVGNLTLFNVTGAVAVRLFATCEVDVTGSATLEVGTAISTAGIIAQTTGTAIDASEIWHDSTPDSSVELSTVVAEKIVNQNIILTVGTSAATVGRILFTAIWKPIGEDSYLVTTNLGGSASASASPSASLSPSTSLSPSASASISPSSSLSPSASTSPSSSASRSPSASISPSSSASSSPSASISPSSSASTSPSVSVSPSRSTSASISPSTSTSPSSSGSPSPSPSEF